MAIFNSKKDRGEVAQSVVNAAKTLLANIRFMSVDNPVRTIAFTSSAPNEGKTFISCNLASAIATSHKTVLIVECDMRRRSVANALGVHAQYGLYAVLSGQKELGQAAVRTKTPNLHFLDAEPHIPNPSDILSSKHFARLLSLMRKTYDYVIFDTPPVGAFVDAAVLGAQIDAIFMVVRENFVNRNELLEAAEQLRHSNCNLAGVVMNHCEHRSSEYYYDYYKRDHTDQGRQVPVMSSSRAGADQAAGSAVAAFSAGAAAAVPSRPDRPRSAPAESEIFHRLVPEVGAEADASRHARAEQPKATQVEVPARPTRHSRAIDA